MAGVMRVGRVTARGDEGADLPVNVAGNGAGPDERDCEVERITGDFLQLEQSRRRFAGGNDAADVAPVVPEPGHNVGQHPFARCNRAAGRRTADVAGARAGNEIREQGQAAAGARLQGGAEIAPDGQFGPAGPHERGQQGLGMVAEIERGAEGGEFRRGLDHAQIGEGAVDGPGPVKHPDQSGGQVVELDAEFARVATGQKGLRFFQVRPAGLQRAGRGVAGVGEAGEIEGGEIGCLAVGVKQGGAVRFDEQE